MTERHIPIDGEQSCAPGCICSTDSDLLLLRKNAAGERMAIYNYICAAEKTGGALCKLFTEIAQDEMIHFRRIMSVLAKYDPIQDCALSEACINLPPAESYRKSKSCSSIEAIELLSASLYHELNDINEYQSDCQCANHRDVKILFCETANDEKLHVAKLWKALISYTNENTCRP